MKIKSNKEYLGKHILLHGDVNMSNICLCDSSCYKFFDIMIYLVLGLIDAIWREIEKGETQKPMLSSASLYMVRLLRATICGL